VAKSTVRMRGLREFGRAAGKAEKSTKKVVKEKLGAAGEIVRAEGERRFQRYDVRSASKFKVRVWGRGYGTFVEQSLRKTTGQHPEYARLQVRELEGALEAKQGQVEDRLEQALDELADILED
jgi:hypothetical protein